MGSHSWLVSHIQINKRQSRCRTNKPYTNICWLKVKYSWITTFTVVNGLIGNKIFNLQAMLQQVC